MFFQKRIFPDLDENKRNRNWSSDAAIATQSDCTYQILIHLKRTFAMAIFTKFFIADLVISGARLQELNSRRAFSYRLSNWHRVVQNF